MEIETPFWRDGHLHLRQLNSEGNLLPILAKFSKRFCSEVVVEPNTIPSINTAEDIIKYKQDCQSYLGDCNPLLMIKLTAGTTPEIVRQAKKAGVVGVKVYPEGVTTNSFDGITRELLFSRFSFLNNIFKVIEEEELILRFHGELPGSFVMDRESDFLQVFGEIANDFPGMRMTLEHITTEASVNKIDELTNKGLPVAATVTLHHLWMANGLDDLMGGMLKPDWFCKPVPKRPSDHKALVRSLLSNRIFMGTDSAAHPPEKKYSSSCCAGCLTACHPEMLVQSFESFGLLPLLADFTSVRMGNFYHLPLTEKRLSFIKEQWEVPSAVDGLVPFLAGTKLEWQLKSTE